MDSFLGCVGVVRLDGIEGAREIGELEFWEMFGGLIGESRL
jgi:hypothetical protein